MKVLELQVQPIVARSVGRKLDAYGHVFVVDEVDLGLGRALHREVDAASDARLLQVDEDKVLLVDFAGGQVVSAHFDFVHKPLMSLIVATDATVERTADYVFAVILHVNLVVAAHFRGVRNVH